MKKSQQATSRRRSAMIHRRQAKNRKLRRWWKAMIVEPLKAERQDSRANRIARLEMLTGGRKPKLKHPGAQRFRFRLRATRGRRRKMSAPVVTRQETAMEMLALAGIATCQPTNPAKERWPKPAAVTAR